ncbi:DegT/DnrJ/EryC1/StrS family aminotransferase [Bradyrhizobium sp. INPA01-394B]|uniref:DegT/DnrJ/EryC1/StrS family aminotransferase n=1 Tax=Bradyrhizobium campsiandrae TaxID=1729892 RepID=A0ABR7UFB4_9BRAD|nr:DegT/DnrJ/EryC1/StrS family aminotransferase [Bradyrhizobium campsiandrae]MBC9876498.1 DegT/DnrJ/EryC1/StrS family aminotransferase [Bradyrhizobium campsiandrae]MBC9982645.1 DegT/DnrJ/EryC1/StrS family aminotransferase [Bradyrhizobium campsiandrae]
MTEPALVYDDVAEAAEAPAEAGHDFIPLSDPDITLAEIGAVDAVLRAPRISNGPLSEAFEEAFAAYVGRAYAVAVPSGTIGLLLALKAYGIGAGDEVIASAYSFREAAHAISLAGARPVFADIDYWSGNLAPAKVEERITPSTRAILAANTNGHPAPWSDLRDIATRHGLVLLEDSTEAIGSRYKERLVGSFGDVAVFDFAQPSLLTCGEGGMVVTDNIDLAVTLRRHRSHRLSERSSVVVGSAAPYQVGLSNLAAALGLAQLKRIDEIIERRRLVEQLYATHVQSFEGIKPPYVAPDVTEVNWFLYLVHLGTRFTRSSRDAIAEDLRVEQIEAAAYSHPLHLQRHYFDLGYRRGDLLVTEKIADRAIALPFHTHLTDSQIEFIVETMKDASINVGAGAAIY